jgi:membrane associated rhomboid family serine protease
MSADRLQEWVKSVPICTFCLFAVNSGIHAMVFLFSIPLGQYSISPVRVLYQHEYYRMVTSSFLHGGLLHIGMNMMSLLQIGPSLVSDGLELWSVY